MAHQPEADRFEQLREDVARILERIRAIEGRLERLESSAGPPSRGEGAGFASGAEPPRGVAPVA
nr:hypothetical protein [Planctomycetales bacterium]